MKIAAGYLSDALGTRKPLVFLGYALSSIGRSGLALAGSGAAVFAAPFAFGAALAALSLIALRFVPRFSNSQEA
jgi:hypothetical protein